MKKRDRYGEVFRRWFDDYTRARRKNKIPQHKTLADFRHAPTSPDELQHIVSALGEHRVIRELDIKPRTLGRWLAGESRIPRCAVLLLRLWHEGRLPDMSDDWRYFRFQGDRLCIVGTRFSYSAREISGWQYKEALLRAMQERCAALEDEIKALMAAGTFGSANDPILQPGQLRHFRKMMPLR